MRHSFYRLLLGPLDDRGRWLAPLALCLLAMSASEPDVRASTADSMKGFAALPLVRDDGPRSSGGDFRARGALLALLAGVLVVSLALRQRRSHVAVGGARIGAALWSSLLLGKPSSRPLQVMQTARLTHRASLHVVRWNGKELLLGCSDQGIAVLGTAGAGAEPLLGADEVAEEQAPRVAGSLGHRSGEQA